MTESAVEHIYNARQILTWLAQNVTDAADVPGAVKVEWSQKLADAQKRLVKATVAIEAGNVKPEPPARP